MESTETDLARIVGTADPRRVSAAVDRLRSALDEGTYVEIALRDVLLDSTSEERIALMRLLDAPAVEEAELTAQRRADAGAAFLNPDASERERDQALADAFPELARDDEDGEEYELLS